MRCCPWCEGRKVTGRMVYGEGGQTFKLGSVATPVVGMIVDRSCGVCGGTGEVSEEKHALLTGANNGR